VDEGLDSPVYLVVFLEQLLQSFGPVFGFTATPTRELFKWRV
jgi:hypothetical protein